MRAKLWLCVAGLLAATGVGIGAFQAHGMEKMLAAQELNAADISHRLELCSTAVRFQLIHAVALMGVAIISRLHPRSVIWSSVGALFLVGVLCFCGALYGISFADMKQIAHVAPMGGISLMVAWLLVAVGSFWFSPDVAE